MSQTAKTYDLKNVFVTFNGIKIGGYGADGAVELEWSSDLNEVIVGADGETVVNRLNDDNAYVTITLLETSRAYRLLAAQMQAQALETTILPKPFLLYDVNNGDKIKTAYAVFLTRPSMAKGRTAGTRQFRLLLTGAAKTAVYGANNLI